MPAEIDWIELWRELVTISARSHTPANESNCQARFLKKTQERSDPLLDFVVQDIERGDTALDVGAGSGRWSMAMARVAGSVTAVEPSDAMVRMLRDTIHAKGLNNVQVLQSKWEDAIVDVHDIVICAHAIYFSPDFSAFVRKMEKCARKKCYLALRLPPCDGIIGELSLKIRGSRHDSGNAIVAYNALYSMGIYANVFVEPDILRWEDSTLDQAFARAKRHLRLQSTDSYDDLIQETLANRLTRTDGAYLWPDGMRGALLWWEPSPVAR